MFSVLTRTSNRPNFFLHCRESVKAQTLPAWHIVSTDDPNDTYLDADKIVEVMPETGRGHNLYLNTMRLYVPADHPFVIFLDDDDRFFRNDALEIIRDAIFTADSLVLWRVKMPDGRIIPEREGPPVFGEITGIGCAFHVKNWVNWQNVTGADFLVIQELYRKLKPVWIETVLTEMMQIGGGNRTDHVY